MLFLMAGDIQAQDSTSTKIEAQLETNFEELDPENSGISGEQLTQFLEDLAADPVNINIAGINDLLQVPGMDLIKAKAILTYRENKPFESIGELVKIPGIGSVTFDRMSPYVTIGGSKERFRDMYMNPDYWKANTRVEMINRFQQNLEEQEGYIRPDSGGGYLGSPVKYYQRIRMQSDHLSLNLTQEKDAGETLEGVSGFDLNSWHIALQNNGKLDQLIIGDYSLSFGQGLVLWTGGAFGKGREVIGSANRNERGLRPYSSAQETDFFRGVAASYGEKVKTTVFYSNRKRTASVVQNDSVRFPSSSGFHRTVNELSRKNNLGQKTIGYRVTVQTPVGILGSTGYHNEFDTYILRGSAVEDQFDFEGKVHSVAGFDYRAIINSTLFYGEVARSRNGGIASIVGFQTRIGGHTELSVSARNFNEDFQSFFGDGFGERSGDPQNERGVYFGLRHAISNKITLSSYIDHYTFPFAINGVSKPSKGNDLLGLIEIEVSRKLNGYILYRNEVKESDFTIYDNYGREVDQSGKERRQSIRMQFEYNSSPALRLRPRIEYVWFTPAGGEKEQGFLIYQDVRVQITGNLRADMRHTLFDTDSFDTRVYQYETDLLYVMSNTVLSDRGQRSYVVLKYEPVRFLDIRIKYAVSRYEDVFSLSSGLNEITGNKRSYFGAQIRWSFK